MDELIKKSIESMASVNAITWATYKQIQLRDDIVFLVKDMPYLNDMVNCDKRVMNVKKGTQVCMTTTKYLEAVHACLYRKYDQNVLYMMPTVETVQKLAKVSFDPIFNYNPWLKKHVTTSNDTIKTINGRSIVFVGARPQKVAGSTKDSANLRSIACDCVKRDEPDLMDPDMIDLSKQRLNRSTFRIEENYGSPTYPGWGIDLMYELSDQRKWQMKCNSCGKYTCVVQDFPDSIILKDGKWIRACKHCRKEIFVKDGSWQPDFPDRREAGFWLDGLISPYADLEEYMYRYHNTDGTKRSEFMRSILGIAMTEAENQLTEQDVLDACGPDLIQTFSTGETVMGVDVGKKLHVVIGIKTGRDVYDILYVGRCDTFGDLHLLAKKMNVKYCVIDAMPDTHKIKEFAKEEPYVVSRAFCSENYNTGRPKWDPKDGTVKANRNEWMDKVHEIFVTKKIRIPKFSQELQEYAVELTKTAKTTIEHPDTGVLKPRWIKLSGGNDHYYLSTLYFLLAASRVSPSRRDGTANVRFTKQKSTYRIGGKR